MHRRAALVAITGTSALLASPSLATAAPTAHVRAISGGKTLDRGSGLVAGYGYAAWIAEIGRGQRRVAVRQPDGTVRRAWLPGKLTLELRRQPDLRTGKTVTRLVTLRRQRDGSITPTPRSPVTLRPASTQWADAEPGVTVDAGTRVSVKVEADPSAPVDVTKAPPTRCIFSASSDLPLIPPLADCGPVGLVLRGSLLVASYGVPSATSADGEKGQVNGDALAVYSTARPDLGWRRLASGTESYSSASGLLGACASERGVALLEGVRPSIFEVKADTWTLRWIPADPDQSGWTADVPTLRRGAFDPDDDVRLACDGRTVYGEYLRISRVVRFVPPSS